MYYFLAAIIVMIESISLCKRTSVGIVGKLECLYAVDQVWKDVHLLEEEGRAASLFPFQGLIQCRMVYESWLNAFHACCVSTFLCVHIPLCEIFRSSHKDKQSWAAERVLGRNF